MAKLDGTPEALEGIRASVQAQIAANLPGWGKEAIWLRDPLNPNAPSILMDDRAEVTEWEELEQFRVWLQQALTIATGIITKDMSRMLVVGFFLGMLVFCLLLSFSYLTHFAVLFSACEEALVPQVIRPSQDSRRRSTRGRSVHPRGGGSR